MLAPLRIALISAAVLLASVATASATATQVAPAVGAKLTTAFPVFKWTVPDGEQEFQLTVTPTAKLVDGELDSSERMNRGVLATTSPFVDRTTVYTPGDYFWQIRTTNGGETSDTFQMLVTPVSRFIVPPIFQFSSLRPKITDNASNGMSEVELNGILRCNMAQGSTKVSMKVFRGTRLLHVDTREVGCFGMTANKLFHNFQPRPGQIRAGTILSIQMSAVDGFLKTAAPTKTFVKWHN
jgi:hypothetical protein